MSSKRISRAQFRKNLGLPVLTAQQKREGRAIRDKLNKSMIKAVVKKQIASELETKFVSFTQTDSGRNSNLALADVIPCLPPLVQDQGLGSSFQRLGCKVSPKSLYTDVHVSLYPALLRSTAVIVHVYVLTCKAFKSMPTVLSSAPITKLLRSGDANQTFNFDGHIDNAMLPINNADFTLIKHKKFVLQKNTGLTQDEIGDGNQPLGGPISKSFRVKLDPPAKLIYEQDGNLPRTVLYPNNYAPFMLIGYTHTDGSIIDYANQDIFVTVRPSLWYDDA